MCYGRAAPLSLIVRQHEWHSWVNRLNKLGECLSDAESERFDEWRWAVQKRSLSLEGKALTRQLNCSCSLSVDEGKAAG